jgi:hypothetical protein
MSDLNEPRIKEENIRGVESNAFSSTFPFDGVARSTGVAVFVDIEAKFCVFKLAKDHLTRSVNLTVIAKKEFFLCRS